MLSFEAKYLKYKKKYLELKNLIGGANTGKGGDELHRSISDDIFKEHFLIELFEQEIFKLYVKQKWTGPEDLPLMEFIPGDKAKNYAHVFWFFTNEAERKITDETLRTSEICHFTIFPVKDPALEHSSVHLTLYQDASRVNKHHFSMIFNKSYKDFRLIEKLKRYKKNLTTDNRAYHQDNLARKIANIFINFYNEYVTHHRFDLEINKKSTAEYENWTKSIKKKTASAIVSPFLNQPVAAPGVAPVPRGGPVPVAPVPGGGPVPVAPVPGGGPVAPVVPPNDQNVTTIVTKFGMYTVNDDIRYINQVATAFNITATNYSDKINEILKALIKWDRNIIQFAQKLGMVGELSDLSVKEICDNAVKVGVPGIVGGYSNTPNWANQCFTAINDYSPKQGGKAIESADVSEIYRKEIQRIIDTFDIMHDYEDNHSYINRVAEAFDIKAYAYKDQIHLILIALKPWIDNMLSFAEKLGGLNTKKIIDIYVKSKNYNIPGLSNTDNKSGWANRCFNALSNVSSPSKILKGHKGWVFTVAVINNNIISGSGDNTIKIYDKNTGETTKTLEGHTDWVLSIASIRLVNKFIVSGSADNSIKLWNFTTGECFSTLIGHSDWVKSVAVYNNVLGINSNMTNYLGSRIVSGSMDHTIKIWDYKTCLQTLEGHTDSVNSVAIYKTPDNPKGYLIISGSTDSTVKIWDPNTGTCLKTLKGHTDSVNSVAIFKISDDRGFIVSGSDDGTIRIWNLNTGEHLHTLTGHTGCVSSIVVGELLGEILVISGWSDCTIKITNLKGDYHRVITDYIGEGVKSLALEYINDGYKIISGSADNTIKVFDPKSSSYSIAPIRNPPSPTDELPFGFEDLDDWEIDSQELFDLRQALINWRYAKTWEERDRILANPLFALEFNGHDL